jgi:hypothetical protein
MERLYILFWRCLLQKSNPIGKCSAQKRDQQFTDRFFCQNQDTLREVKSQKSKVKIEN